MGRTSIRLSESSNSSLTHVETEMPEGYIPKQGWHVSYVTGFILVLAAIALSTAVGLIVHFAHPVRRAPCPSTPSTTKPVVGTSPDAVTSPVTAPGTTPDWDQAWEACKNLSAARNQCLPGFDCSTTASPGTSSPPTTAPPTSKNIRLPGDLRPSHYDLRLRPHIYSSNTSEFYFNGSMTAYFSCVSPTKVITLHAKLLHTSNQQLRSGDDKVIQVVKVTPEEDLDFLHLVLETALEANVSYELSMDFRGPIRKDLKGIYYSDYTVNGQTKYLLTSQLQTTDARKVFPCFDEPALKATFNTTIEYRPPLRTMSNTEVYHAEQLNNGWVADHYSTTPLMSTYILAFMISDFNCTKTYTTNGKLVEICARPNAMDQTDFAASIAGGMQEFFEDYHNISYPLPKTIHAAVQDFAAGAMENWGLIIYRETALLYDPDTATADQRQRVAKVISHELAHQWFGNLVTASWWDDIWLNEGFASYLENLGVNHTFPDWDLTNEMVVTKVQRVLVADSLASSRPIYQEVNSYVDISQVFDAVTYSKGASVIRMMKYFLGEETFRWGLSNYLKDRAYSTATSSDLFRFMTKQASSDGKPVDVEGVMDTWVRQMGYPVVTFTLDKVNGRVDLTQRHFLLDAAQTVDRPSPYNYTWKVPVSVVTDKSSDWNNYTTGWLNEAKGAVVTNEPNAAWIIGNVKQRYYYRVNYDQANWDALVKQLQTDPEKIHVANRAQLIDDSINLGRANYVEQTLALGVSLYLKQEKQYIPWVSVARAFGYMDRMLSQTAYYGLFKVCIWRLGLVMPERYRRLGLVMPERYRRPERVKQFMQKNVEPTYKIIGWNKGVNDTHLEQRLRTLITNQACHYSLPSCLKEADAQYQRWMSRDAQNASNSIDPNLRPVVYCHGVETGSQAEWEFAFRKYQEVNTGAEKSTLLRALGCSKQAWLLRRYLQEGLDETVLRRQDFHIIFRHIAANHDGRVVAWQFLQDNWPVIRKRFGDSTFALRKAVTSTTAGFSTERELKELQNFMDANPDQGNAALAFKKAVETAKSNIDWRKMNELKIQTWLEQQSYSL